MIRKDHEQMYAICFFFKCVFHSDFSALNAFSQRTLMENVVGSLVFHDF